MKIAVFTGTRAEYGLLYWLLKDIQSDSTLELQLLVSGTHLSPDHGLTYQAIEEDGFVINEKIEVLLSGDTPVSVAKSVGLGVLGYTDALERMKPDFLVVLGDRFEALAVVQVSMLLRIPVVHLHGGEITEGAYDDSIRHAISKLSYIHCASMEVYRHRIIRMGEDPSRVFNVGAIGLDHLRRTKLMTRRELSSSLCFTLDKPFFILTYHPVTLADEGPEKTCESILSAIDLFPDYNVIITYPNADDGGKKIIPILERYAKTNPLRALVVPSLGQLRYLSAVKECSAVLGNSSSGVIEVPSFKRATVNIGARQRGRVSACSVVDCGVEVNEIHDAISEVLSVAFAEVLNNVKNPYGSGNASKKVIEAIKNVDVNLAKKFYDGIVEGV
ncbi:UDP-N-acetylglucosamine 2-epimerase [Marinagarivorans algicola]|uniref:UDP-N-acetylglucosamine 2-epimerase n=1 Tax=Marinagarivorans algicola TaxID=1513270 RepID=UPI0006B469AB|nr:UDP-N-acetylglucosamine 2-epimerase [Marinagarivorans algicola]